MGMFAIAMHVYVTDVACPQLETWRYASHAPRSMRGMNMKMGLKGETKRGSAMARSTVTGKDDSLAALLCCLVDLGLVLRRALG